MTCAPYSCCCCWWCFLCKTASTGNIYQPCCEPSFTLIKLYPSDSSKLVSSAAIDECLVRRILNAMLFNIYRILPDGNMRLLAVLAAALGILVGATESQLSSIGGNGHPQRPLEFRHPLEIRSLISCECCIPMSHLVEFTFL